MPVELIVLFIAAGAFVGSHFLFSHRWRARLVGTFGEAGFQVVYSLVAMVLLVCILAAYHMSPHRAVLWSANNPVLQLVFSVVSYFAVVLFLGSLSGNPALIGANLNGLSTRSPSGAFEITRHPMMFSIAIWSLAQIMIMPSIRNLIACTAFIVLAVAGSHWQDQKKSQAMPREWNMWISRTRFWPELRKSGALGATWIFAAVPWALSNWLEVRLTFVPVGLWYFFPELGY